MKYIILNILILAFFGCNSKKEDTSEIANNHLNRESNKKLSGKEIISELETLGYFNLTDQSELEEVKDDFEKSYTDLNFFQGPMRGETLNFMDNRYHWVDCEELFELGGLIEYLAQVKLTFEKLGLQLEFDNEKSEEGQNAWRHTIELNGTEYVAFNGPYSDHDLSIAYVNFIEMLNAELRRQNSDEQFYPINCGNDGMFIMLTPKQLDFINRNYPIDDEHPTTLSAWKINNEM